MRGSAADIRLDAHLPPVYSLLHAKHEMIAIEVLLSATSKVAKRDAVTLLRSVLRDLGRCGGRRHRGGGHAV
jgi:hypothetical protein